MHPLLLHFACAVLEVKNRIALAEVGLVIGRGIYVNPAPGLLHVTPEIVLANFSVRHVAHQVVVIVRRGNLYVTCPSVAVYNL